MTEENARRIVVMGVSGSGKSTIGALLSERLGVPFVDGDSLHPAANVEKMRAGIPLDDADRWPWLARVGQELVDAPAGLVVACSALKRSYREAILREAPGTRFVFLNGTPELLASRMAHRPGHFMPPSLLASQLDTLEPLASDEPGIVVDIGAPADTVVAQIARAVSS